MRRAWLALVLGACGSGGVLEVQVVAPEGVAIAEVELYAGVYEGHVEPLRPAEYPTMLGAVWWKRDRDPTRDVQKLGADGTVTYAYRPGGGDDDLEALVVVGFDAQGVPVAVGTRLEQTNIPNESEIHRYKIPLVAFDSLPRSAPPTTDRPGLQVWGPGHDPRACVHVDNLEAIGKFSGATSAMIATEDDPDCDGFPDEDPKECVMREYAGQAPLTRDSLSCMLETPITTANGTTTACIAGGGTCADGSGEDPDGCHPSSYCLPGGLCKACANLTCDGGLVNQDAITHVVCTLPTREESSTGEVFCSGNAGISLQSIVPGIQCADAAKMRDLVQPFDTHIDYASGGSITLQTVDAAQCLYKFVASGAVPSVGSVVRRDLPAILAVPLVLPVKGRGIGIPILFRANNNGCVTAPSCQIVMAQPETLSACVRAPVEPGTLVLD